MSQTGAIEPYRPRNRVIFHHQNGSQCQLVCGGCRTLLVYPYGSSRVRCALCSFVTGVPTPRRIEVAHIQCEGCGVTLMYPGGAHAVRCAFCQYITCLVPHRTEEGTQIQTVIVENPMTMDEDGRLVSCVCVGISTR